MTDFATIPMQQVGPINIKGKGFDEPVSVPLATYETPLWPSVSRGARISMHCDGITALVTRECMSRSIAVQANSITEAHKIAQAIQQQRQTLQQEVAKSSQFAQLLDVHIEHLGNILYLRLEFSTGDASGHNMVTLASEHIQRWILTTYPELRYIAISANMCTDKKVSAINSIRGRGKSVTAEMTIPRKLCTRFLHTDPETIVELHIKKNLLGSIAAGSLRSANAHFANLLLAFYLATGQDAANIVEGSQGIVHTEVIDGDLYFSVNLPNIIVGTVGNGKELPFVQENLKQLGCIEKADPGENARKLAMIAAATVLCGELSLLGAITNEGELMKSHVHLERPTRS